MRTQVRSQMSKERIWVQQAGFRRRNPLSRLTIDVLDPVVVHERRRRGCHQCQLKQFKRLGCTRELADRV